MANPNLFSTTVMLGKTTGANLTSTSATTVLNNPSGSNHCMKVNTLNVANYGGSAAVITIVYNNGANLGGTSHTIIGNVAIPSNTTLNVIDKSSQYYLEDNASIGATAGTANTLYVTVSYEDMY